MNKEPIVSANPQSIRLYKAMKSKGWGVIRLSEETGITKQTIRNLLRAETTTGSLYTWGILAKALGVDLDYFYNGASCVQLAEMITRSLYDGIKKDA